MYYYVIVKHDNDINIIDVYSLKVTLASHLGN